MKSVNSKFSIGTANFDNAYGLNQKKFSKKKIKELVSFLRKKKYYSFRYSDKLR